jgi:hypothetical protein
LDQVSGVERAQYLEWFKTLPLWLDLGDVRIVHACWHEESMNLVERELGSNRFNALDQFMRASQKGNPLYDAIEVLLKGPEISLVDDGQPPYLDKDGHRREQSRVRWWNNDASTLREIAEMGGNFTTQARRALSSTALHQGPCGSPILRLHRDSARVLRSLLA